MSTNATYGIRKNGELISMYCHYDGYLDGLGLDLIATIKSYGVEQIGFLFDNIIMVNKSSLPTKEQIDYCVKQGWMNLTTGGGGKNDWYCLIRKTQGNLDLLIQQLKRTDLECNEVYGLSYKPFSFYYNYIIDLDANEFQFYKYDRLVATFPLDRIYDFSFEDIIDCLEKQRDTNKTVVEILPLFEATAKEHLEKEKALAKERVLLLIANGFEDFNKYQLKKDIIALLN